MGMFDGSCRYCGCSLADYSKIRYSRHAPDPHDPTPWNYCCRDCYIKGKSAFKKKASNPALIDVADLVTMKNVPKPVAKAIKFTVLVFLLLSLISAGPINKLLAEIDILHFENARGTFILFEKNDGSISAKPYITVFNLGSYLLGFFDLGFYVSMAVTILFIYYLFDLFATTFLSYIFIFVALCIINFFVITAFDGAIDIRFISLIQVILGPKIMLIIGCIYRFFFVEH